MEIQNIKDYVGEFKRAPFLFVGSGISRRYLNIEDWNGLLSKFSESIGIDYQYLLSSAEQNLPIVASELANKFHPKWWEENEYERSRKKYKAICTDRDSALKIEISHYIKGCISNLTTDKELLREINLLKKVVIDGVITTNWDNFLESLFTDFKTYVGQNELIFSAPQGIGEIYKIHGCSSQPNSLVLTQRDYEDFDKRNPYLAAKLLTIFTEHPVVFLGYSLQDENILKILDSISSCLTSDNIKKLQDRLIFIQWNPNIKKTKFVNETISIKGIRIPVKSITVSNFISTFTALSQINRKFPARMLRQLKEHVYDLVIDNDKQSKLYVQNIDSDTENIENLEVVFGVGAINKIAGAGYKRIGRNDLIENLIKNKYLDISKIISDTLPESLKSTKYIPFFKYIRENENINSEKELINITEQRICKHFNNAKIIDFYYPTVNSYVKRKTEVEKENLDLEQIIEKYDWKVFLQIFPYINKENYKSSDLLKIIEENFSILEGNNSSERSCFYKLICFYDWLKFYYE
ncbi:SIR2 family protein [Tenacibaculum dicentrarchi]|uniref:SIR2 family protein n=1 Tax=Tenacibaculum dicentrarchi TaxID=669041 RepID=UPI0035117E46